MNQSGRDMEEPARYHVRALAPARPELKPGATEGDMAEHISIAMVVAAGRDPALGARTYEHRPRRVERELTDESRRRCSPSQPIGADGSYCRRSALRNDAATLQLAETSPGPVFRNDPRRESAAEAQEAFDHGVHLLGHFELAEVSRSDGHAYFEVGLEREQSGDFRCSVASGPTH